MDFSKARILCLGDVMLDRFAYCDTERISPEAPVPVLLLKETRCMLGGAGNVARNIAALGGQAVLLGLLGRDAPGDEVRQLVRDTRGLIDANVASATRPTICKTRYMAGHQQLLRVDEERVHELDADEAAALIAAVERALPDVDAVILSDYAKSALHPEVVERAIGRARELGIPSYVDPKTDDFSRYRGATCITPNQKELGQAARLPVASDSDVIFAASKVMREAEAARKRRFRDKRRQAGWQDQLIWLSPEGQAALAALRQPGETLDACINRALITASETVVTRTRPVTSPPQAWTSPVPSPPPLETHEPRHQAQRGTSPVPSPVPK